MAAMVKRNEHPGSSGVCPSPSKDPSPDSRTARHHTAHSESLRPMAATMIRLQLTAMRKKGALDNTEMVLLDRILSQNIQTSQPQIFRNHRHLSKKCRSSQLFTCFPADFSTEKTQRQMTGLQVHGSDLPLELELKRIEKDWGQREISPVKLST